MEKFSENYRTYFFCCLSDGEKHSFFPSKFSKKGLALFFFLFFYLSYDVKMKIETFYTNDKGWSHFNVTRMVFI